MSSVQTYTLPPFVTLTTRLWPSTNLCMSRISFSERPVWADRICFASCWSSDEEPSDGNRWGMIGGSFDTWAASGFEGSEADD